MIRNYLKIAWRNLKRNKGFSHMNVLGLAIAMASAILILLWVKNEIGYDRFFTHTDRIYRIFGRQQINGQLSTFRQTPEVLAPELKKNFPEVEEAVRFNNVTFLVTGNNKHLNVTGAFADSEFLSMFDFPPLQGNIAGALQASHDIVITHNLAKKLFGQESAIGKTIRIDSTDNFIVSAVLQDLPGNTQFSFEYLLPWNYRNQLEWNDDNWTNNFVNTFVLLRKGASQHAFDDKIQNLIAERTKGDVIESNAQIFTHPLKQLYLYSRSENGKLVGGRIEMVKLFCWIAGFILLIGCINFMNLSTAYGERRAKEVGVRKVSGAGKKSLVFQFVVESTLIAFCSFFIAIFLVHFSLPSFEALAGKGLSVNFSEPQFWIFAILFILITGLIAGSYPAFFLSSFSPIKALKRQSGKLQSLFGIRKILVVVQFTFAVILIICTIIVKNQIDFAKERNSGYEKDHLVFTFTQGEVNDHFESIKNELLTSGAAVSVTRSFNPITKRWNSGSGFRWPGSTDAASKTQFVRLGTDADFVKTLGVKLIAGRDIDIYQHPSDSNAILLNESAVKMMGLQDPIGTIVRRDNYPGEMKVVGVIEDFILESPYEKINPTIVTGPEQFYQVVHMKLNGSNITSANLAKVESIFKKYNPQYPFDYVFVDESYAQKFKEEYTVGKLSGLFAGLTIFISCLGLFGLVSFMAESRLKEIGVRKVLGASGWNITALLSKDFFKLIVLSILIASPFAWLIMNSWLSNYHYHTNIEWYVFVFAALIMIVMAMITVSWKTIKAALNNPVKSLRSE